MTGRVADFLRHTFTASSRPQYGLYVGELLRVKPAREQAQNGPDACAPLALPFWPERPQPWGDGGTGASSLSTPQTAAAGTPRLQSSPPPTRARQSSKQGWGLLR